MRSTLSGRPLFPARLELLRDQSADDLDAQAHPYIAKSRM
jgi:hypothetical protein